MLAILPFWRNGKTARMPDWIAQKGETMSLVRVPAIPNGIPLPSPLVGVVGKDVDLEILRLIGGST